jgi:hypothetical protein
MKISSNRPVASTNTPNTAEPKAGSKAVSTDQSRYASSFSSASTSGSAAKAEMTDSSSNDFLSSTLADLKGGTSNSEGGKMLDEVLEDSKFGATVKDSVAQGLSEWASENPGASVDEMKDKMVSLAKDADLRMQSLERMMKRMKELNPWKD